MKDMINWLIEHYAEIAVYSALASLIIGVISVIVYAVYEVIFRYKYTDRRTRNN